MIGLFLCSISQAQEYQDTSYYNIDPLLLDEVLISDNHGAQKLLNTSSSAFQSKITSSVNTLSSIADLPGIFLDQSLGEVYSRVFTRGITASAEDDIGWYYTSLQEDGLPLSTVQYNYFTPDFFHRNDLFDDKVEAIIGGKSGILSQNSPGGIINFTSRAAVSPRSHTEVRLTAGIQGEGRSYHKSEIYLNDWISGGWHYNLGAHYRWDQGHRNTPYTWSQGGQIRMKVAKVFDKGLLQFHIKRLDDRTNRHTGLAATNWQNPTAAFDQNFNYSALMLPGFDGFVGNEENGYAFNPARGIRVQNTDLGVSYDGSLSDYVDISYKGKYSQKSMDWQTSFANNPIGLDNFLAYFISGDNFPVGTVQFFDAQDEDLLASVNNVGVLAQFQGLPGSFEYLSGRLPNDAVMGIAAWKKDDQLNEIMNNLAINMELASHRINLELFQSRSELSYFSNASYAYATYEPMPRMLRVDVSDINGQDRLISDDNGLSNYGGLFFENGSIDVDQWAISANDQWQISDLTMLDFGMRYELISHDGSQNPSSAIDQTGGLDGDESTGYDNGFLTSSGESIDFSYSYDYASGSIGLSHQLTETTSLFSRYSLLHKAPELNYYIQNFANAPLPGSGEVQEIDQLELGAKHRSGWLSFGITAFSSRLSNIADSEFFFDTQTNELIYTPVQINSTTSIGLEAQWSVRLSDHWSLLGNQTIMNSTANEFTVYQANGTADTSDDMVLDFSDSNLPHQPNVMSQISITYSSAKLKGQVDWSYMGRRYGNIENSFELPAFNTFAASLNYEITKWISVSARAENITNSVGLMNFFGPNSFGSSANQATSEFINQNPDASFVVFPILPRAFRFSIYYQMP